MRKSFLVGKEPIENIFLMETHDQAYSIWKKIEAKNMILIHVDAHLDFGWIPEKKLSEMLLSYSDYEDSQPSAKRMIRELKQQEKVEIITTGNYLYPALKDGMIKEVFWIVPDKIWEEPEERTIIKKIFQQFLEKSPEEKAKKILFRDNRIVATICNRRFTTCRLADLPSVNETVLLNIDLDFFMVNSRLEELAGITVKNKKPWMRPSELITVLKNKGIRTGCVTVSYSVEEGFTPIEYKYLGDEIADFLRNPNETSLHKSN